MRSKIMMTMAIAAGTLFGQYRDEYGRPSRGGYYGDDYGYEDGYVAPAPPPVPVYARHYRRPPMPGPGCLWVDGYWGFNRGRYAWVNGYWARPPYGGAFWVGPRYHGGRFYTGYWSRPNHRWGGYGYRGGYRR